MNKHTPGPWEIDSEQPSTVKKFTHGNRLSIATVHGGYGEKTRRTANARLIAAAPEMLEALEDALNLIDTITPFEGDTVRKARAAIAKARGEA